MKRPWIGRDRTSQIVTREVQVYQAGQITQPWRDRTSQLVFEKDQIDDSDPGSGRRLGWSRGDRHCDHWGRSRLRRWCGQSRLGLFTWPAEGQAEIGEVIALYVLQPCGHTPGQLVAIELERIQAGQVAQRLWDRPDQLVISEI